jgi:hypothetical protein
MTDETPVRPSAAEDLQAMAVAAPPVEELGSSGRSMSRRAKVIGIVATALVAGIVGVVTLQSSSASPSANAGPGGGPGGRPGLGQGGFRGGQGGGQGFGQGGQLGARGLMGTVVSISSSSLTITSAQGSTTVQVTSATTVLVNGAQGSLSDVTKGATVLVRTSGTGSALVADRIFVGGGGVRGRGFGQPPGQQQGTGTAGSGTITHT